MLKATLAILILIFIVGTISGFELAIAHDHDHPELDAWFDGLKSDKGPCCSYADGEAISDADWKSVDGHYQVRFGIEWVDVPDSAVITVPNLDGRTIVWPIRYGGEIAI